MTLNDIGLISNLNINSLELTHKMLKCGFFSDNKFHLELFKITK